MKKYFSMMINSIKASMMYRVNFILAFVGNIFSLIITFFLWQAIFANSTNIGGMTFNQTFLYLSMAIVMASLVQSYTEWWMSHSIISGDVVTDFMKPYDYQIFQFVRSMGFAVTNLITTCIPTLILLFLVFDIQLPVNSQPLYFVLSLFPAIILNFLMDYIVGVTCFYTQSVWGISVTKSVIILFLSGAVVPLSFFPIEVVEVFEKLPFFAMYALPLGYLTGTHSYSLLEGLAFQWAWVIGMIVITRFFLVVQHDQ